MVKLSSSVLVFSIVWSLVVTTTHSFMVVPLTSTRKSSVVLQMMEEECPEIPTTPQMSTNYETCILASGWFWHPQRQFKYTNGIARVVVGYTGGDEPNPTYQNIKDATEAYLIEFDPTIISYQQILNDVRTYILWLHSHHWNIHMIWYNTRICVCVHICCFNSWKSNKNTNVYFVSVVFFVMMVIVGRTSIAILSIQTSISIGYICDQWGTTSDCIESNWRNER